MNNKTLGQWLKKLAYQLNAKESNSHENHIIKTKVTGRSFRNMIQSEESFTINSKFRLAFGGNGPLQFPENFNTIKLNLKKDLDSEETLEITKDEEVHEVQGPVCLGNKVTYLNTDDKPLERITYPCAVQIHECIFLSDVNITFINSEYHISFRHCTFESSLHVYDLNIKGIYFYDCEFKKDVVFWSSILEVGIYDCTFKNLHFSSTEANKIGCIKLYNVTTIELVFNNEKYGSLFIENLICAKFLFRPDYGKSDQDVAITRTSFDSIEILVSEKYQTDYNLLNIDTGLLRFSGTSTNMVFIKNTTANCLDIENFINDGKLRLHNFRLNKNVNSFIVGSQLGKAEFNNVDFSQIEKLQIMLSNLTEIINTNTDFPVNIIGRDEKDYKEIREAFRQLKYAYGRQGDRIKELRYEQLEMSAYEKSLSSINYLPDRIILLTNKFSNNHGQSWIRAVLWFVLFTITLYIFVKISLGYSIVFGLVSEDIAQYLNFSINPLHDFDKVFKDDLTNGYPTGRARFYDVVSKIISGYLIFQFLRAFRKYVK